MASSPENGVYGCGLDLLQGLQIVYQDQQEVDKIAWRVAFTNRCAIAILLRAEMVNAVCFPVVKNSGKLWIFAAVNSARLQSIVDELAFTWKSFQTLNREIFFFNLRGYCCFSGSTDVKEV